MDKGSDDTFKHHHVHILNSYIVCYLTSIIIISRYPPFLSPSHFLLKTEDHTRSFKRFSIGILKFDGHSMNSFFWGFRYPILSYHESSSYVSPVKSSAVIYPPSILVPSPRGPSRTCFQFLFRNILQFEIFSVSFFLFGCFPWLSPPVSHFLLGFLLS